jgi:hypothetical protein
MITYVNYFEIGSSDDFFHSFSNALNWNMWGQQILQSLMIRFFPHTSPFRSHRDTWLRIRTVGPTNLAVTHDPIFKCPNIWARVRLLQIWARVSETFEFVFHSFLNVLNLNMRGQQISQSLMIRFFKCLKLSKIKTLESFSQLFECLEFGFVPTNLAYVCVHIYIYIHIYTHIHTLIHMCRSWHTHTHTHTHTQTHRHAYRRHKQKAYPLCFWFKIFDSLSF